MGTEPDVVQEGVTHGVDDPRAAVKEDAEAAAAATTSEDVLATGSIVKLVGLPELPYLGVAGMPNGKVGKVVGRLVPGEPKVSRPGDGWHEYEDVPAWQRPRAVREDECLWRVQWLCDGGDGPQFVLAEKDNLIPEDSPHFHANTAEEEEEQEEEDAVKREETRRMDEGDGSWVVDLELTKKEEAQALKLLAKKAANKASKAVQKVGEMFAFRPQGRSEEDDSSFDEL
eukprot:TRINITY_DN52057_c0_g1_i1.p2 TRINITY_DN52057_c0_g1~~TRINITY_DN52057_c0_g1_i1.p2  ORF type:complete len:228 (-),score=77.36 TRINITY_DN52057_c0_g1_i1:307-990(-)